MWGEGSLWLLPFSGRPFSGMRGGASCALHLAVDALGVVSGDWRRP